MKTLIRNLEIFVKCYEIYETFERKVFHRNCL